MILKILIINYQSFYCKIVSHLDSHTESFNEFMEEFKKIFPSEYNCQGHQFEIVTVIIFFINVILYIFGIIYIIIFIIEIIRKLERNYCTLCVFIYFMLFLLFLLVYISSQMPKTNFDHPEKIYIFDDELNDEIKEHVNNVQKRKIYGILEFILTLIIYITTIIKIVILFRKENNNLENNILINYRTYIYT